MEVRPACPASWPCPSTNHPRAIGNRGSPAGSAGYSKQDLNRSNTKSPWSENRGDRTYKEGVGGSSPSAPTRNVEKPGRFAALEAVGECPCRALSLSFHGRSAYGPWFTGGVPVRTPPADSATRCYSELRSLDSNNNPARTAYSSKVAALKDLFGGNSIGLKLGL